MTIEEIDLWVSIEQVLEPWEYRLFVMYHAWKMNQMQIAEEMDCCQQTVSRRLIHVRKKLQYFLQRGA